MKRRGNIRGGLTCKALLLALVLAMLLACTAAANAESVSVSTDEELRTSVSAGGTKTITLTKDITLTQTLNFGSGAQITIDLNGHTLSRGGNVGTMFNIDNGGELTITDSAVNDPEPDSFNPPDGDNNNDTSDGTGVGMPATYNDVNDLLTWYETTSVPQGITTDETHQKYTVTVAGRIISDSAANAPIFRVYNSGSMLTIDGGFFMNDGGRVITAENGAVLNLRGGYLYGSGADGISGGAVYVSSWNGNENSRTTINVGGQDNKKIVFAGNHAAIGGALTMEGYVNVQIQNGAVFSGNYATGGGKDGGGAIYIGSNAVATMTGGLVTHNWCVPNIIGASEGSSSYATGGGGILVLGQLRLDGGAVTWNEAAGGGGISTRFWDGGSIVMTDGIVAGNVARINEGGGITVNLNGSASITHGYITNNHTRTTQHWGGGGLFSADRSTVTMTGLLITDNTADGYGGGLAGCSTGRIDIDVPAVDIQNHSVAIYENIAHGTELSGDESTKNEDHIYAANDPVFTRDGKHYQDYFCALSSSVCSGFLGDGWANWSGTVDGLRIDKDTVPKEQSIAAQYIAGLTSHPSPEAINNAIPYAQVIVSGNTSGTHGGGILVNGYLIVGSPINPRSMVIGDRMTISGSKTLTGGSLTDGQFTFNVYDEKAGRVIMTGTNNANGEIVFDGRIPFNEAGTYTYRIYEENTASASGVEMDSTVYYMTVTVTQEQQSVGAVDPDGSFGSIGVAFNRISRVTIDESKNGGARRQVADYSNIDTQNNSAYAPLYVFEFENKKSTGTGLAVSKTVHGPTGQTSPLFDFTVTLSDSSINGAYGGMTFTNGVANFQLSGGESKAATGLPAGVTYTVTEAEETGYLADHSVHNGTLVQGALSNAQFTNTAVGNLEITKTVNSPVDDDKTREFAIEIKLNPGTNINGPYGDVVFENGVAQTGIKHGETIRVTNLPAGVAYTVEELTADGFTANITSSSGVIARGQTSSAAFVNTRDTGDLRIRKHVVGENVDPNQEFEFTVKLGGATNATGTKITGEFGDMDFVNGVATIWLGDDEIAEATGLPTGTPYQITEKHNGAYAVSVVGNDNGTIQKGDNVVEYTNTKFTGLAISKTTTGTVLDRNAPFTFEIVLKDGQGDPIPDKTYGDVPFKNGVGNVSLRDGENAIITGLPNGTKYTVTETNVDSNKYIVRVNGETVENDEPKATGTLTAGGSAHADFTNLRKVGSLAISKRTDSPLTSDLTRQFGFNVVVSEPITGRFGDVDFVNGQATVYLAHEQTKKAENLPAGMTYTITEIPDAQFIQSSHNYSDTTPKPTIIANETVKADFVNTRRLGSLAVTKTVKGIAAGNDQFGFKVVLDRLINGRFGGMTFVNGIAEFTLAAGDMVTATDLPAGIGYTIIETTYDSMRFAPVVSRIEGDISPSEPTVVSFVNEVAGGLRVSKTIEGEGADMTRKFDFTVTLDDKSINGVYGGMTFVNGVATFELGHLESAVASGLPYGTRYTVTEDSEDYRVEKTGDTGEIAPLTISEAEFINSRDVSDLPETGDDSSLLLYTGLLAVCSALMIVLLRRMKRA